MRIPRRLAAATALAAGTVLASLPTLAVAHADLTRSDPPADAALDTPPTEVVLAFDGELEPDGSGFEVTDASGTRVGDGTLDLEVADRNVLRGEVSISADGEYTVRWTAVSIDGHAEEGRYTFGVGSDAAAPDSPDTAVSTTSPLVALGLAVVAAALVLAIRARARRPG